MHGLSSGPFVHVSGEQEAIVGCDDLRQRKVVRDRRSSASWDLATTAHEGRDGELNLVQYPAAGARGERGRTTYRTVAPETRINELDGHGGEVDVGKGPGRSVRVRPGHGEPVRRGRIARH